MILVVTLFGLLTKDRVFSPNENRNLAQRPKITISAIADGSFLSDLSTYYADQFPGRDSWLSIQLFVNKLMGSKEAGGVYLGKDNFLMQIPSQPNEEQLKKNLKKMEAFAKAHPDVNMVASIIPNAVTVYEEKLPQNAPVRDQREDLKQLDAALTQVKFVDVTKTLCEKNTEQLFYRTDYHWTSLGACYGADALLREMPVAPAASQAVTEHPSLSRNAPFSIKADERERIERALRMSGGNVKRAAELLEISRRTLYRKLDKYRIDCAWIRENER